MDFYRDLYSTKCQEEPEVELSFLEDMPQVGDEHSRAVDAPLSAEELMVALHGLASGKAPGLDELHAEFYNAFWPVLSEDFLCALRDNLNLKVLGDLPW